MLCDCAARFVAPCRTKVEGLRAREFPNRVVLVFDSVGARAPGIAFNAFGALFSVPAEGLERDCGRSRAAETAARCYVLLPAGSTRWRAKVRCALRHTRTTRRNSVTPCARALLSPSAQKFVRTGAFRFGGGLVLNVARCALPCRMLCAGSERPCLLFCRFALLLGLVLQEQS